MISPPDADRPTVLLTITGLDRPGVTRTLFAALSGLPPLPFVEVLDVEQVVLRGRLTLGVLLGGRTAAGASCVLATELITAIAEQVGRQLSVHVEVTTGLGDQAPSRVGRAHVTVIGAPLAPSAVAVVAREIARNGANIDRIDRVAHYPVTALEFAVSGALDVGELRDAISSAAATHAVDVAVQPSGLHRRASRLVVMDVDSTLITGEVIEMLAAHAGCEEQVAAVTAAAMAGELDFEASLRARVGLLAGLDVAAVQSVRDSLTLAPGARTLVRTLKRLGYRVGIVSGGFTQVTDQLVSDLDLDFAAANTLEIVDGRLTGGLVGPIVDRAGKAEALREFAELAQVPLNATVAIGDGANDLDMLALAGLGVAFNAKPAVRAAADTSISFPFLDTILYLLGITRDEVDAADIEEAEAASSGIPRR